MCFYVKNNKKAVTRWVALKDITCYKVIIKNNDPNMITSLHKKFNYKLKHIYKTKLKNINTKLDPNQPERYLTTIHRGFHSYSNKHKAILEYKWEKGWGWSIEIVKCTIPKGSEFYYNSHDKEYVSNQIIIKQIIKKGNELRIRR